MERLQRMLSGAHPPSDSPLLDSSEQVYISSLALLKMLKHGLFFHFLGFTISFNMSNGTHWNEFLDPQFYAGQNLI